MGKNGEVKWMCEIDEAEAGRLGLAFKLEVCSYQNHGTELSSLMNGNPERFMPQERGRQTQKYKVTR